MSNARMTKPDRDSIPSLDVTRAKRIIRPGKRRLTLRGMREGMGVTQVEVAEALGIEQGDVSRMERRPDMLLSTLRRYARAIGAECEVAFVFPKTGHRIVVADPTE
jgi:predicted transcriptional regulator